MIHMYAIHPGYRFFQYFFPVSMPFSYLCFMLLFCLSISLFPSLAVLIFETLCNPAHLSPLASHQFVKQFYIFGHVWKLLYLKYKQMFNKIYIFLLIYIIFYYFFYLFCYMSVAYALLYSYIVRYLRLLLLPLLECF